MSDDKVIPETAPKMEIMRQIGKTLADRRAARSLTLEKILQATKIRLPYLQAIERGEWSELPGEVYVRGFVKRYAQYLGLDGEKLMEPYLKFGDSPLQTESHSSSPSGSSEPGRVQWQWIVLGGILLIGFIKVIKQDRASAPKPVVSKPVPAAAAPAAAKPETAEKAEPAAAVAETHSLEVITPFPLWLRVTASDKNFEGFIPQGSTWSWKGQGQFTVRLGHVKEVTLLFDGKPIPLADDQRKVTLPL